MSSRGPPAFPPQPSLLRSSPGLPYLPCLNAHLGPSMSKNSRQDFVRQQPRQQSGPALPPLSWHKDKVLPVSMLRKSQLGAVGNKGSRSSSLFAWPAGKVCPEAHGVCLLRPAPCNAHTHTTPPLCAFMVICESRGRGCHTPELGAGLNHKTNFPLRELNPRVPTPMQFRTPREEKSHDL